MESANKNCFRSSYMKFWNIICQQSQWGLNITYKINYRREKEYQTGSIYQSMNNLSNKYVKRKEKERQCWGIKQ
jgi:hypothetical protein